MPVLETKYDWICCGYLHNDVLVPPESVRVIIGSWVEPEIVLDLTTANAIGEEVGVKNVRLPG